jgi:RNA polymerase sigma-70 factor, ECF subfamily
MAALRMSIEQGKHGPDAAALVKRIARGDKSAFATLYDSTCGLIYGLLLRILGNSAAADQIMVAVYQELWEQAATYDDEREKPMTWLITMAHSRAITRLRTDKRSQPLQASLESVNRTLMNESEPDELISERQKFIQSVFTELSPMQQQVIELAYFSGLRQNQVAARLSLSPQSVRTGIQSAMRKLRDMSGSRQLHLA